MASRAHDWCVAVAVRDHVHVYWGGFVVGFYKGSGVHDLSPSPFTVLNELKWSNKKLHNFLLDLVL